MKELAGAALDDRLRAFLAEDVGPGGRHDRDDRPLRGPRRGELVAKSDCVVSGLPVARRVFELLDPEISWEGAAEPGARVAAGTRLASLAGRARADPDG